MHSGSFNVCMMYRERIDLMCYCVTVTKHFVIHWHSQGDCVYIIPLLLGLLYGCLY